MRANAVGKKCAEVDLAYVAGLIDGDGAIMALIEPHNEKKFRFRVRIEVKITQKKRSDLVFLPRLLGFGSVRANGTTFDWISRDQKELAVFIRNMRSYTRMKQKQLSLALQILNTPIRSERELMRVARLADALSKFNVRSSNRRKNYATMIKAHVSSND
jgi:hypothetical protein